MTEILKLAGTMPDFDTEIARFTPRQMDAVRMLDSGRVKFCLYGGALGGGKSYWLRWYGIRRLMLLNSVFNIKNATAMLACENYPSLEDRQLQKIIFEVPPWIGRYYDKHKAYGRCLLLNKKWGGGALCFRNLDDPSKYASSEWVLILVDELTKNQYDVFTFLRTRLRLPGLPDVEAQFAAGTNPGSIGHGWVKALWMDGIFPDEWCKPIDYRPMFGYVPSKASDNPHLDAGYWAMLGTLPENLREAFKEGNWDIFVGQAFPQLGEAHKIDPLPIPRNAHIYITFDWGYGAPFSFGFWWVDADGRVYRFAEWYGFNGTPNEGLRLTDSQIVERLFEFEASLCRQFDLPMAEHLASPYPDDPARTVNVTMIRGAMRLAGHDCFNRKPDYKGGGQGPSTQEVWSRYGVHLTKGDATRELKIRQFRERLRVPEDGSAPMMLIYKTCTHFFRTVTALVMDENNVEDIDEKGAEDHTYDEACHICMARPLALEGKRERLSLHDKRIDALKRGDVSSYEHIATLEQERELRRLGYDVDADFGDVEPMEDGNLKPTM